MLAEGSLAHFRLIFRETGLIILARRAQDGATRDNLPLNDRNHTLKA
jgi:hypothetical protein